MNKNEWSRDYFYKKGLINRKVNEKGVEVDYIPNVVEFLKIYLKDAVNCAESADGNVFVTIQSADSNVIQIYDKPLCFSISLEELRNSDRINWVSDEEGGFFEFDLYDMLGYHTASPHLYLVYLFTNKEDALKKIDAGKEAGYALDCLDNMEYILPNL